MPTSRAPRGRRPQSSSDDDSDSEYEPSAHEAAAAEDEAYVVDLTAATDSDDDAGRTARRQVRRTASRLSYIILRSSYAVRCALISLFRAQTAALCLSRG